MTLSLLYRTNKSVSIFFIISAIITIALSIVDIRLSLTLLIPICCSLYLTSKYLELSKFKINLYNCIQIKYNGEIFGIEDFRKEIGNTITLYEKFMDANQLIYDNLMFIEMTKGSFISFGRTVNGICSGNYLKVSYWDDRQLDATALSHEIGHYLLKIYLGTNDENTHHKFMKDNKLP